jgi:hypothetical protein
MAPEERGHGADTMDGLRDPPQDGVSGCTTNNPLEITSPGERRRDGRPR